MSYYNDKIIFMELSQKTNTKNEIFFPGTVDMFSPIFITIWIIEIICKVCDY